MSFCVALQSAIFFVVSCTPCHQAKHHQKLRAQAKKDRQEKERTRAAYPGDYQQPDPFNTNPYWSEEIMMGPHIEAKKYYGGSKNTSRRNLASAGKDTASVGGSSIGINITRPDTAPATAEEGKLSFSTTLSTTISDDWNRKRYQREDEELWGDELSRTGHKLMDAIKHAGASAGRLIEVSLGKEAKPITDQDRHDFYFAPRNPPVNDYHPPIVRQRPLHQDAHRWMLQPPPAAKIMEGKVPVSRSGSFASHVSRRTTASEGQDLGRIVHEKMVEAKLRGGELPAEIGSLTTLGRPAARRSVTATSLSRSRSLSLESSDLSDEPPKRRMARTRWIDTTDSDSYESDMFFKTTDSGGRGKKAAVKPRLSTISGPHNTEKSAGDGLEVM
ncbi:hypothetical protein F5Y19DRAFT_91539 [Xylariaceae sp. FL1651]|nr:hypothetical protein F5Y19DRAFT_91539 [Xylariaceae sp. FL1651]